MNNGAYEVIKMNDEKGTNLIGARRTGTWAVRKIEGRFVKNTDGSIMTFGKQKIAFNVANQMADGMFKGV